MPQFVTYRKVREKYDISPQTLRNWAIRGKVNYRTIENNTRKTWLYEIDSIGKYIASNQRDSGEDGDTSQVLTRVLYARVSSKKQQNDFERQMQLLQKRFPTGEIISDIGSGINYKRPGFSRLVERICRGEIKEVVVTYRDRLLRFGYELFEQICHEHGVRILVLSQSKGFSDPTGTNAGTLQEGGEYEQRADREEQELQEDLLSIVNVFVARQNGRRAGQLRRERQKEEKKEKTGTNQFKKNKALSNKNPKTKVDSSI